VGRATNQRHVSSVVTNQASTSAKLLRAGGARRGLLVA